MKSSIDRILFTTSIEYSDFWETQSRIWKEVFNIEPMCVVYGHSHEKRLTERYGPVEYRIFDPSIPDIIQITWSKFTIPRTRPDDIWLIGDIDMFPLQTHWFTSHVSELLEHNNADFDLNAYIHLNSLGTVRQVHGNPTFTNLEHEVCTTNVFNRNFPAHYHVSKGYTFGQMYSDDYSWFFEHPYYKDKDLWCAEESRSTECIQQHVRAGSINFIGSCYHNTAQRIDRISYANGYTYDKQKLVNSEYVDLHCMRPFEKYRDEHIDILKQAKML